MIHFGLLFKPNINPTARSIFGRSLQCDSFPELANFISFKMMHGLYRIHESYIIKIRMHFEEMFAQILRCL